MIPWEFREYAVYAEEQLYKSGGQIGQDCEAASNGTRFYKMKIPKPEVLKELADLWEKRNEGRFEQEKIYQANELAKARKSPTPEARRPLPEKQKRSYPNSPPVEQQDKLELAPYPLSKVRQKMEKLVQERKERKLCV